eukprot:gene9014-1113_t
MTEYEENMHDIHESEGNKPLHMIKRKIQQLWFPVFSALVVFGICSIIIVITLLTYRPLTPQAQYNIAILGAWGTGNSKQQTVAKLLNSTDPLDFIISTGDNFFPNGIKNTTDSLISTLWNQVYNGAPPLSLVPWYLVLGPIDWRINPSAQTKIPLENWNMPGYFFTQDRIFIGGERAQFIFIDTTRFSDQDRIDYPDTVGKQSKEDIINALEALLSRYQTQYRWRFVVGHHNMYGSGPSGDWGHKNMTQIEDLFKKYDVDGYFSGQDGVLQVLEDRFPANNRSLSYFVSGAGGDFFNGNLTANPKNIFVKEPKQEGFLLQTLTRWKCCF